MCGAKDVFGADFGMSYVNCFLFVNSHRLSDSIKLSCADETHRLLADQTHRFSAHQSSVDRFTVAGLTSGSTFGM